MTARVRRDEPQFPSLFGGQAADHFYGCGMGGIVDHVIVAAQFGERPVNFFDIHRLGGDKIVEMEAELVHCPLFLSDRAQMLPRDIADNRLPFGGEVADKFLKAHMAAPTPLAMECAAHNITARGQIKREGEDKRHPQPVAGTP